MKKVTQKIKRKYWKKYLQGVMLLSEAIKSDLCDLIKMRWAKIYSLPQKPHVRIEKIGDWIIAIKKIEKNLVHPTPEDFRPTIKANRRKKNGGCFLI